MRSPERAPPFQPERGTIRWRLHFASTPAKVYEALATDAGRAGYWAESADERGGIITFNILGFPPFTGRVLEREPGRVFAIRYLDANVRFELQDDGRGGTDLTLVSTDVPDSDRVETLAGWVSVLMAMKASVDFGVDLRNHDIARTWQQGYADN